MTFRLSKFHLFCFVSMTFSHSLYFSSVEVNTDRKMERQVQRVVCSSLVAHKYIDNEQSPVIKRRASLKMDRSNSGVECKSR